MEKVIFMLLVQHTLFPKQLIGFDRTFVAVGLALGKEGLRFRKAYWLGLTSLCYFCNFSPKPACIT